jgi:hypothetical protein
MMKVGLNHLLSARGLAPTSKPNRRGLNDEIIDSFLRLRFSRIKVALERIVFGYQIAVEIWLN